MSGRKNADDGNLFLGEYFAWYPPGIPADGAIDQYIGGLLGHVHVALDVVGQLPDVCVDGSAAYRALIGVGHATSIKGAGRVSRRCGS